jgi:hypothetical protein
MKKPKKIRKSRIRTDHKGEFIFHHHFLNEKQKLTKVYLIDGVPSDGIDHYQIYLENVDDMTPMKDGEYCELDRRYSGIPQSDVNFNDNPPF